MDINMMEIKFEQAKELKKKPKDTDEIGFGRLFTDYMFMMDWDAGQGWHDGRIIPFQNISLHPASTVLHYGSEIFEGLKAYRRPDGKVQLFRPLENIRRLNDSAERLCLPTIPEGLSMHVLTEFVKLEQDWTPSGEGMTLYLRPFMFGDDHNLGVHDVSHATYVIIASPVKSYYKEGLKPVRIMIESDDVRAVRGGTGYAKCGGNYGASTRAGKRATELGFSQVLWLDGVERKYIEEVGAMNVMFKIGDEIITPKLTGSILPGITRKSCIELLEKEGYKVSQRLLSVDELSKAMEDGTLVEAWGCGTAAVVAPIGELCYKGKSFIVNNREIGPVTKHLYDVLTGIQWGKLPDTFGWTQLL